jgi:hypothetical protein
MALKTKICLAPFRRSLFSFSQGLIHFGLRILYSLDLFGSFLYQAKNEQKKQGLKWTNCPNKLYLALNIQ